jgi:hypothetical protein
MNACAAAHGGSFFLLGGACMPDANHPPGESGLSGMWDCWVFTPDDAAHPAAGGAWRQLPLTGARPPGATPGLHIAAAVLLPPTGELLLLGGQTNVGYSSEVYAVNLATGVVRCLAPPPGCAVPPARGAASAALLPGSRRVLYAGGSTADADAGDAWLFDLPSQAWLRLPIVDSGAACTRPSAPDENDEALAAFEPPVFGQGTLVAVDAESPDDAEAPDAPALVLAWGGRAYDCSGAGRAAGAAQPRLLVHGALRVMRLEPAPEQQ